MESTQRMSRGYWLTLIGCILLCVPGCLGFAARSQTAGNALGIRAAKMLKALDTLNGDTKAISIVEIDEKGESTLYEYVRFRNPSDRPIDVLPGVGSFAAIPFLSIGGEQARVEFGEYLPNKIERHFTARLQHPVPPGGLVEMIMVGERIGKYTAKKHSDGCWQLGPMKPESSDPSVCIFAVRLPASAHLVAVYPKPDEVRSEAFPTIVWHKGLSAGNDLELSVKYRL